MSVGVSPEMSPRDRFVTTTSEIPSVVEAVDFLSGAGSDRDKIASLASCGLRVRC